MQNHKFEPISLVHDNDTLRVRLYCNESESESDIASTWVYGESNLMFILNNGQE